MTTPQPLPVVVCADDIIALYPTWRVNLKAIAICGPFILLGTILKMEWLGMIVCALAVGLLVIPQLLRMIRFICSLPCAACSLPAGKYTSKKFIIHLKCKHCGHLSRTDCMQLGPGKPSKV